MSSIAHSCRITGAIKGPSIAAATLLAGLLWGNAADGAEKSLISAKSPAAVGIQMDSDVADWAIDPASGRLFATLATSNTVAECDPAQGKIVRTFVVGDHPGQMVVKGQRLVVMINERPALAIIDLAKNEVEGRVALDAVRPRGLFATAVDNSFVYFLAEPKENAQEDAEALRTAVETEGLASATALRFHRVDIAKRTDASSLNVFPMAKLPYHAAAAPDGQFVILQATPGDLNLVVARLDEQAGKLADLQAVRVSTDGPAAIGPAGLFAVIGNGFYRVDSLQHKPLAELDGGDQRSRMELSYVGRRRRARDVPDEGGANQLPAEKAFAGTQIALHPELNLVAVLSASPEGAKITFQDRAANTLAAVDLPAGDAQAPGTRPILKSQVKTGQAAGAAAMADFSGVPLLAFDAPRNRLIYAHGRVAYRVDLAALKIAAEPLVLFRRLPNVTCDVGKQIKVPLELVNPKAKPRLEKLEGPAAATIADGALVWQSGIGDVGTFVVKIRAVGKSSVDTVEVQVRVAHPSIRVPFNIQDVVVSDDARWAVAIGREAAGDHDGGENRAKSDRIAVVDLTRQIVVATKTFDKELVACEVKAGVVYVAPAEGNLIYALKAEDLSQIRRVFVGAPVRGLWLAPGGLLVAATEKGVDCFRTDNLTKTALPGTSVTDEFDNRRDYAALMDDDRGGRRTASPVTYLNEGTRVGSVILDRKTGKVRMLLPGSLPLVELGMDEGQGRRMRWRDQRATLQIAWTPTLWSRRLTDKGLYADGNSPLATWGNAAALLLREVPLVASVDNVGTPQRDEFVPDAEGRLHVKPEKAPRLTLTYRDLTEGKVQAKIVLAEVNISNVLSGRGFREAHLADAGQGLVVGFGDEVFVVPLSDAFVSKLPRPVQFRLPQRPAVASATEQVSLPFSATGGKGAKTYSLLSQQPGVSIDPKSGTVVVDSPAIWRRFASNVEASSGYDEELKQLRAGITLAQQALKAAIATETTEVPTGITIALEATDEEGMTDRIVSQLIILGPMQEFEKAAATAKKRFDEEQRKQAAARLRHEAELQAQKPVPAGAVADGAVLKQLAQAFEVTAEMSDRVSQLDRRINAIGQGVGELKGGVEKLQAGSGKQQGSAQLEAAEEGNRLAKLDGKIAQFERRMSVVNETVRLQQESQGRALMVAVILAGIPAVLLLFCLAFILVQRRGNSAGSQVK